MQVDEEILDGVRAALEREAHIDPVNHPIALKFSDGVLTLEGALPGIATKKLALGAAASVPGVKEVVDRLRLVPTVELGDGAIRDAVCKWLSRDVDFLNCTMRIHTSGRVEVLRDAGPEPSGDIEILVEGGVVSLKGHVISLSHKRLAGVLASWARGCRDVVNELDVIPGEEDNDEEVIEALRLVLETDPFVHAEQIGIDSRDYVVTLRGVVATEEERRCAELDAWNLHAVRKVANHIEVRP